MGRTRKKAITIMGACGSAVLVTFVVGVSTLFLGSLFPIPGGLEVKIVQSGSMEPAIMTGGIVVIRPQHSYQVGDVITFGGDPKTEVPTTHRVISRYDEAGVTYFETKGDANEEVDLKPVSEGAVIGRVLFSVPYAGFLLDFARKPLGFALLIAVPALFVIVSELVTIAFELRGVLRRRKYGSDGVQDLPADTGKPIVDLRPLGESRVAVPSSDMNQ